MKNSKATLKRVYTVIIILSLIAAAVVIRRTVALIPTLENGFQPHTPQADTRLDALAQTDDIFAQYPYLTLIHIIPGLVFLLLAPFQFSNKIRSRNIQWHRRAGRIVIVSGLITGITAFIMTIAMPSVGGVNQAAATFIFSLFFLFALIRAYQKIIHKQIALHREWMIRAYAIGLAIATIRPIVGVFFGTSMFTGLTPHEFFGIAFWIGFVLHLIIAEVWIYNTRIPATTEFSR